MTRSDIAVAQFRKGSACSQSVAVAFARDIGLDTEVAHRVTTGFGGGMGGRQYTCGVVTGGVFVLSARYGTENPDETEKKAAMKRIVARFIDAFEARLGSSSCRELLGTNLDDARKKDLFSTVCADCVRVAAEEIERLI